MQPDTNYYQYAPYAGRPRITWPNNAQIALWVAPNIEFYELDPPPNPGRAMWARPTPDILNYSHKDYGNRAGFWRMAEVMARYNIRGSVSLNVALADHVPEIIERCCELGWELFSHGIYNTRFLYNMNEDEQREVIRDVRETIFKYSGQSLDGWLSPALSNTDATHHILAEEGIKYALDILHDDQPMPLDVRSGRLISIPYSLEVNDVPLFNLRDSSPQRYVDILKAQFDQLHAEGAESGTVMCMPLHPFLIGQPHRIAALDEVLRYIADQPGVWLATGREIADHYYEHHYEEVKAWIAAGTPA